MHDGGGARVQELQPLQNLPAPAPQHLGLHHLEALQVAVTEKRERALFRSPFGPNNTPVGVWLRCVCVCRTDLGRFFRLPVEHVL